MGEEEIELLRRLAMSRPGGNSGNAHPLNDANAKGETSSRGFRDGREHSSGHAARHLPLRPASAHSSSVPSRSAMSRSALSRIEQELFAPAARRSKSAPQAMVQNELRAAINMLRRRWRLIAISAASGIILAAAYAFTATVQFKSTTQIAIDPKRLTVLETPDDRRRREEPVFDPARIDSQVEAAKSYAVGRMVGEEPRSRERPGIQRQRSVVLRDLARAHHRPVRRRRYRDVCRAARDGDGRGRAGRAEGVAGGEHLRDVDRFLVGAAGQGRA